MAQENGSLHHWFPRAVQTTHRSFELPGLRAKIGLAGVNQTFVKASKPACRQDGSITHFPGGVVAQALGPSAAVGGPFYLRQEQSDFRSVGSEACAPCRGRAASGRIAWPGEPATGPHDGGLAYLISLGLRRASAFCASCDRGGPVRLESCLCLGDRTNG